MPKADISLFCHHSLTNGDQELPYSGECQYVFYARTVYNLHASLLAADVTCHPWEDLRRVLNAAGSAFKLPSAKLLVDLNSLKAEFG